MGLLFETAEQRRAWDGERENAGESPKPGVWRDLRLDAVCGTLRDYNPDYRDAYLKFFNTDPAVAVFRAKIMEEISSSRELREGLCDVVHKIALLRLAFRNHMDRRPGAGKNHSYFLLLLRYFETVDALLSALENAVAGGLCLLREEYRGKKEEHSGLEAELAGLKAGMDKALSVRVFLDFSGGVSVDFEPGDCGEGIVRGLGRLARNLLDIDTEECFSLVSQTENEIELFVRDEIMSKNKALFARIEALEGALPAGAFSELFELEPEILYYTAYAWFVEKCSQKGVCFSIPEYGGGLRFLRTVDPGFAAAHREDSAFAPVYNDFEFGERPGFILTGANQGGKTTFLRCIGANMILANSGLPIPARYGSVSGCPAVYTLFSKGEGSGWDRGRLREEIARFEEILALAGPGDFVLFNEPFAGTRRGESVYILSRAAAALEKKGARWGVVTHFYEFYDAAAPKEEGVLCLEAAVAPDGSGKRLYTFVEKAPGHVSHAADIVKKCRMTYDDILAALETEETEKNAVLRDGAGRGEARRD